MTGIATGAAALLGVAFGWWGVVALAALTLLMLVMRQDPALYATGALIFVVASVGAWRAAGGASSSSSAIVPPTEGVATVVTAPVRTGQRQYFVAEFAIRSGPHEPERAVRTCVTSDTLPAVGLGDTVRLSGVSRAAVDASSSQRAALATRDCAATMFADSHELVSSGVGLFRQFSVARSLFATNLRMAAPGDTGVLLTGLVTGDDEGFSPARQDAFLRAGATHLTAVSGSNLTLIAGILASAATATIGRHRLVWQPVTVTGLWAFAFLTGAHPPVIRAVIVASAAVFAFRFGRRADFPTLIMLAAGTMVLYEPRQIELLGFRLSVVASLALAIVLPEMIARSTTERLSVALVAIVAAQVSTLPLLLATFGTVSLGSLPANLLAVPLAAFAMPIAALAGMLSVVWPPLGEVVAAPAMLAASGIIATVDVFGAPRGYVGAGVPPLAATMIIAATGSAVLSIMSGGAGRALRRAMGKRISGESATVGGASDPRSGTPT